MRDDPAVFFEPVFAIFSRTAGVFAIWRSLGRLWVDFCRPRRRQMVSNFSCFLRPLRDQILHWAEFSMKPGGAILRLPLNYFVKHTCFIDALSLLS